MVRTEGLTHVHLVVEDLARSLRFYTEVFGMVERFRDGPATVFLRTPGTRDTVTLHERPGWSGPGGGGVDHIGFRLADGQELDDAVRQVEAAGGVLIERGVHPSGRPFAYVGDPDGHRIEL